VSETSALVEGYALKENRVYKLSILAALLEKDLFGGFIWTDQVKGVGSGDIAEIVDYEEFNSAEITQYRGILDDIAREVGGRVIKQDITAESRIEIEAYNYDNAIAAIAPRSGGNSESPSESESNRYGAQVGQDDDGG
jgi:hypothetical protein